MDDTIINGNAYQIGKIDAMKQLHVSRRILPVLIAAGISISDLTTHGDVSQENWWMLVADKAIDVVAKMTDEDVDYVVFTCLAAVRRRPEGGDGQWARVMNGKQLQFQDLDMRSMVQLTMSVLRENMGGFFPQQADKTST
jgi:hypothetical protein